MNTRTGFTHDPCVAAYRANKTNKCITEIIAARVRDDVEFGSEEYMNISRTCTLADCNMKYHWCPTCCIAPRCDCRMPHQSPITIPEDESPSGEAETKWITSQMDVLIRMRVIPCDNRYWTFIFMMKSLAAAPSDKPLRSKFCEDCTTMIRSVKNDILDVSGRTYLEQSHYMWEILRNAPREMCSDCIMFINRLPCMYMGCNCPSDELELITTRLEEYQSRKTRDAHRALEHTRISSIRSALVNASRRISKQPCPDPLESGMLEVETNSPTSSSREGEINWNVTFKYATSKQRARKTPIVKPNPRPPADNIDMVRSEEWTYFWSDPDGPIKSLDDQDVDF